MMNNQQKGVQDQGSVSSTSFPLQMPDSRGFSFSSQQRVLAIEGISSSQSLRTNGLCYTSSGHFESAPDGFLNFPSIPCWPQEQEMGSSAAFLNQILFEVSDSAEKNYATSQSRDTLQSLVQSSESYKDNIIHQICNLSGQKLLEFQQNESAVNNGKDRSHYSNTSFQRNLQILDLSPLKFQDRYYSPGPITTTSSSNLERTAMAKRNRIRWTQELHNQFIECVNRLGGAKKATPKGILKLMNCDGLTIFHIKSHLQKYRVALYVPNYKKENAEKICKSSSSELDPEMGTKIIEALKMQIDVQQRLYEQLECQKNLQSRIEEQAQQLKKMLERQV